MMMLNQGAPEDSYARYFRSGVENYRTGHADDEVDIDNITESRKTLGLKRASKTQPIREEEEGSCISKEQVLDISAFSHSGIVKEREESLAVKEDAQRS